MTTFSTFVDDTLSALPRGEASVRRVGDKFEVTDNAQKLIAQAVADLTFDELQQSITTSRADGVQERLQNAEPAELHLMLLIVISLMLRFLYLVLGVQAEPLEIESA